MSPSDPADCGPRTNTSLGPPAQNLTSIARWLEGRRAIWVSCGSEFGQQTIVDFESDADFYGFLPPADLAVQIRECKSLSSRFRRVRLARKIFVLVTTFWTHTPLKRRPGPRPRISISQHQVRFSDAMISRRNVKLEHRAGPTP